MIVTSEMETTGFSDADLVAQCRAGDREAFGQIVARYQSLICSLAYSATGSLSGSEDVAQETFIAAWKQLPQLREPEKLCPWLCRIARNLACNALHKNGREPSHRAESLEEAAESHSPEPLPVERTISNEELTILWRSIERIPKIYREPLVLFYREHQSIETVARNLELSEDAVKQRLSRGRKMLHEEVLAFVEGALERTNPGKAFTLAVLAAMPAATFSAKAAAAGVAIKGVAGGAKTAGATGLLSMLFGLLIVFVPNFIVYRIAMAGAHSDQERAGIKAFFGKVAVITMAIFLPIAGFILWFTRHQAKLHNLTGLFASILVVIFVPMLFPLAWFAQKKTRSYLSRILNEQYSGALPNPGFEYCSRWSFLGLPLIHVRMDDRFAIFRKPVKAWIAIGHTAIGGLFACGPGAVAPISMGGWAIGLVSFGGLSLGALAIGGIAVGVWPVFGALIVGWQAFNGCFAFGWNEAVGMFAAAHDFALGQMAYATQANNELARQNIWPNPFFRMAEFLNRHWLWMNVFWIIPFFAVWRVNARRRSKQSSNVRVTMHLLIPFLFATFFLSTGCNKSGELSKASTFTQPSGPIELKQHWRAGERIVKSFDMKMTSEISIPRRPAPIKQDIALHQDWAITVLKENADGSHEGEMELLNLRMKLDQDGKNLVGFDSERKAENPEKNPSIVALQQALANMAGAKVQFLLNTSNRLERIDGVEALRGRITVGGGRNDGTEGIKNMFNEGYLRQMIGDSHGLPSNAVQPGDSWPVQDEVSLNEMGSVATDYEFTLRGWENRGKRLCARLEFSGTLKGKPGANPNPAGMSMSLRDGSTSGVSWFDPQLGLTIESSLNQDLTAIMTMPVSIQGKKVSITMTNQMHQVITIKLESVK